MATIRAVGIGNTPLGGFLSGLGEGGYESLVRQQQQRHDEAMKAADFLRNVQLHLLSNPAAAAQARAAGVPETATTAAEQQDISQKADAEKIRQEQLRAKLLEQPVPTQTRIIPKGEPNEGATETTYRVRSPQNPLEYLTFTSLGASNAEAAARAGGTAGATAAAEFPYKVGEKGAPSGPQQTEPITSPAVASTLGVPVGTPSGVAKLVPEMTSARASASQANTAALAERLKRDMWGGLTTSQAEQANIILKQEMDEIGKGLFGPIGRALGFSGQATPEQIRSVVAAARSAVTGGQGTPFRVLGEVK